MSAATRGREVTATTVAWLSQYSALGPEDIASGDPVALVNGMQFGNFTTAPEGWTRVGTAEITVTLVAADDLIANKVDALRAEKTNVRADAQRRVTQIDAQIQQLLAITNEVKA